MLKIRLQRIGRRNQPAFRVVVTESTRGPRAGRNVEVVGTFNPHLDKPELKMDRIKEWMGKGAQVSPRIHNMLVDEKVINGKKINVLPKKSPIVKEKAEGDLSVASDTAQAEGETAPATEVSAEPVSESAQEPAPEIPAEPTPADLPAEASAQTGEPKQEESSSEEKKEESPSAEAIEDKEVKS